MIKIIKNSNENSIQQRSAWHRHSCIGCSVPTPPIYCCSFVSGSDWLYIIIAVDNCYTASDWWICVCKSTNQKSPYLKYFTGRT